MAIGLGVLFLLTGGLLLIIGVIVAISGSNAGNKKMKKIGINILVGGALALLLSLTLCTAGFNAGQH